MTFAAELFDSGRCVRAITSDDAAAAVVAYHYLHRRPPISYAFGLVDGALRGVCTFGVPPSRHLQMSACPSDPDVVLELNRLWVADEEEHSTGSWFVSRCLKALPPRIIVSYADTKQGHAGYIYRAMNWHYAGWTDMDRKTPRLDYVPMNPARHSRESSRSGVSATVRRQPKIKYWTVTGSRSDRRRLKGICGWPSMDWRIDPPPTADFEPLT